MSKHHRAFKLELAKLAQDNSSTVLSKQYQVNASFIKYWALVFRINGASSFTHSQQPYSAEFKLHALNTMTMNRWSLNYTSAYFDLSSPGILFQWQKLYALEGISRLTPKKKGRPTVTKSDSSAKPVEQMTKEELREELAYLRAENDVLKKLEALAQARKKKAKTRRQLSKSSRQNIT
jgi:transposase